MQTKGSLKLLTIIRSAAIHEIRKTESLSQLPVCSVDSRKSLIARRKPFVVSLDIFSMINV